MFVFELMRSKFWLGLAGLSLLAGILMIALLVRSYNAFDAVYYSNLERSHQLFTVPGSLVLSTWNHLTSDDFSSEYVTGPIAETPMPLYRNGNVTTQPAWDYPPGMKFGFWFESGTVPLKRVDGSVLFEQSHLNLAMPIVVLIVVFLVLPVGWGLKLLQRYRRAKAGHCIYCNAVMADPEQCPNCGAEYERLII